MITGECEAGGGSVSQKPWLPPPGQCGRGLFVTFEGGEGTGKSTQVRALAAQVRQAGVEALTAREPGGTDLGEALRPLTRKPAMARRIYGALTGDPHWSRLAPLAEVFLYEAARAQLVAELVRPGLERGAVVLLDRFSDSTCAYQGYGRSLDLETIKTLNGIATSGVRPDLTILLDLDVELGLSRKLGEIGRDAIGREHRDFHERARSGYLAMASAEPGRWAVLDGSQPPGTIAEQVWQLVRPRLPIAGAICNTEG
jgi:dTMP kinase